MTTIQMDGKTMYAWRIDPHRVYEKYRTREWTSAKDLSWALLNDDKSIQLMENTAHGDDASNNFALRVFEHALDWGLGLAALQYIFGCLSAYGRLPKPFKVAADRRGRICVITSTGRVLEFAGKGITF